MYSCHPSFSSDIKYGFNVDWVAFVPVAVMFGTVAVAGIKILAEAGLHRRNMLIVAISLGMGLGVAAVPDVLRELPKALHNIFESPITVGALCAIVLNIFLPEEFIELEEDDFDPEASILTVMENPDVASHGEPLKPAVVAQVNR